MCVWLTIDLNWKMWLRQERVCEGYCLSENGEGYEIKMIETILLLITFVGHIFAGEYQWVLCTEWFNFSQKFDWNKL